MSRVADITSALEATVGLRAVVFLVDDNQDFCIYLWRMLVEARGLGQGHELINSDVVPTALPAMGTGVLVLVFPARKGIEVAVAGAYEALRIQLPNIKCVGVIDKQGEDTGYAQGKVRDALCRRHGEGARANIWLVSAYASARSKSGTDVQVRQKNLDLLGDLKRELLGPPRDDPEVDSSSTTRHQNEVNHLMITGAGFDVADGFGGFGTPIPAELERQLANWLRKAIDGRSGRANGRPPSAAEMKRRDERWESVVGRRWDAIISLARQELSQPRLREQIAKFGSMNKETVDKIAQELGAHAHSNPAIDWLIRYWVQAFLRRFDHRVPKQYLQALEIPWKGWASTNYTGFIDRALVGLGTEEGAQYEVRGTHRRTGWSIFASQDEFAYLRAELRTLYDKPSAISEFKKSQEFLKVHGSIEVPVGMAMMPRDKSFLSGYSKNLPFDVGYGVFGDYLRGLIKAYGKRSKWCIHIVGHGGDDSELAKVLRLFAESLGSRLSILVVDPLPWKSNKGKGAFAVWKENLGVKKGQIRCLPTTPTEYLGAWSSLGPDHSAASRALWGCAVQCDTSWGIVTHEVLRQNLRLVEEGLSESEHKIAKDVPCPVDLPGPAWFAGWLLRQS